MPKIKQPPDKVAVLEINFKIIILLCLQLSFP